MRESAKRIRVGSSVPHAGCRELGPISGSGKALYTSAGQKLSTAQNKLRMQTEDLGGDFAVMDAAVSGEADVTVTGRAFDCSKPAPVQVQVVPAASGSESPPVAVAVAPAAPPPSVEERLKRIDQLKADGHITEEEHSAKRKAVLDEI